MLPTLAQMTPTTILRQLMGRSLPPTPSMLLLSSSLRSPFFARNDGVTTLLSDYAAADDDAAFRPPAPPSQLPKFTPTTMHRPFSFAIAPPRASSSSSGRPAEGSEMFVYSRGRGTGWAPLPLERTRASIMTDDTKRRNTSATENEQRQRRRSWGRCPTTACVGTRRCFSAGGRKSEKTIRNQRDDSAGRSRARKNPSAASVPKKKNKRNEKSKGRHRKSVEAPFVRMRDPIESAFRKKRSRAGGGNAYAHGEVPPAYLARTASTNVYVARCAVVDDETEQADPEVDPAALFAEIHGGGKKEGGRGRLRGLVLPRTFQKSRLVYLPPSDFDDHEPPKSERQVRPEVAFLGRSNAGKSSLINALSAAFSAGGGGGGRGSELARTSKRPGRTQTVNYYGLIPASTSSSDLDRRGGSDGAPSPLPGLSKMYFIDLPGFGYASAPDESVEAWQERTQAFLLSRSGGDALDDDAYLDAEDGDCGVDDNAGGKREEIRQWARSPSSLSSPPLKRLFLLVDSRLGEPTKLDLAVMGWCDEYSVPYTVVLTKVDGASKPGCVRLTNQLCMRYHSLLYGGGYADPDDDDDERGTVSMNPLVHWTSAKDGEGLVELLWSLEADALCDDEVDDGALGGGSDEEREDLDTNDMDSLTKE